jgi:digeranylgeranylglycerophospholipid reductase
VRQRGDQSSTFGLRDGFLVGFPSGDVAITPPGSPSAAKYSIPWKLYPSLTRRQCGKRRHRPHLHLQDSDGSTPPPLSRDLATCEFFLVEWETFITLLLSPADVNCDVLVVGASPSGIAAATSAALGGAEVILLDKDMGGSFDHPANTFFDGMFSLAGLVVETEYVLHDLDGMHIISPDGCVLSIPAPGRFIDRSKFDALYLKRAERAGARLLRGEARSAPLAGSGRRVETDSGEIEARVVIDASGVDGLIARREGLAPLRHPEDVAWAAEAVVELPGLGEERFFEYFVGSISPGWKATFSPGDGDRATLGVFVRGHGRDVRVYLDRFVEFFKEYKSADYDARELKIISINRGGDAIATLPGEIISDSLMATGAAAGMSGMAYAIRAGTIAGEVAAGAVESSDVSKRALSPYVRRWSREFGLEYRMGRASLLTLGRMKDGEIDRLAAGFAKSDLDLSGSFFRKGLSSGIALARSRPRTIPALIRSFVEG